MTTQTKAREDHDFRDFILADSPVITEESWIKRNELESTYYPQIAPLLTFDEDHLLDILVEVERPSRPPRDMPLGHPEDPYPLAYITRRSWLEWALFRGFAPAARRPSIPAWVKRQVVARDGMVCQLCHLPVDKGDLHFDHVKPFSLGGDTNVRNIQVTHAKCNLQKGAKWHANMPA